MYQSTEKILRKGLLLIAMFFLAGGIYAQQTGIFQSYIVLDVNNGGNQFLAGGINSDNAPSFGGSNFGTVTSLVLNGGELKTFKNGGGDVFGGELNYRVYQQGNTPGAFNAVNLPFFQNLASPGDQVWQEVSLGTNLLAGLTPATTFVLEVYWRSPTNQGDNFDSNFSNNFTATFATAPASASVPTMSQWGLILFGLTVLCIGAIALHRREESMAKA
jgi:hypothetical protein